MRIVMTVRYDSYFDFRGRSQLTFLGRINYVGLNEGFGLSQVESILKMIDIEFSDTETYEEQTLFQIESKYGLI